MPQNLNYHFEPGDESTTPHEGHEAGDATVKEAGRRGGQRVRELVEEGKESEMEGDDGAALE